MQACKRASVQTCRRSTLSNHSQHVHELKEKHERPKSELNIAVVDKSLQLSQARLIVQRRSRLRIISLSSQKYCDQFIDNMKDIIHPSAPLILNSGFLFFWKLKSKQKKIARYKCHRIPMAKRLHL